MVKFSRHHLSTLPSTQSYLREWSTRAYLPDGTLVWTTHQTAGYGRRGTPWWGSAGESLAFSFLVRPTPQTAPLLPLCTATALYEAVAPFVREPLFLKWPNDLWCPHGKIAGILTEQTWIGSAPTEAYIGIGLNLYQRAFPSNLPAASLRQIGEPPADPEALLEAFEAQFRIWYAAPPAQLIPVFLQRLWRKGTFLIGETQVIGEIIDWEPEGWLTIDTPEGRHRFAAAQVQVAWPPPFSS